jgi:UDP-N-acetylglucosamine--N-acetylmuramyl-(pentapeptide) pyrophosphoryl-undecaprenol N-acetylglucosamine transferase
MNAFTFLMAGGGTGGHVIPALAVARELRRRGHESLFVGTRQGMEARLAPAAGFPIEWIDIGGLNRVGSRQAMRTLLQLPASVVRAHGIAKGQNAAGVFSMGGYVAGPVMLAARWLRLPTILMEPNAMPGLTNRRMARFADRALLSFEEARPYFPAGRCEITGLPVRDEFFAIPDKVRSNVITVLITGGSRGSRTLNLAARAMWKLLVRDQIEMRLIHQCGKEPFAELETEFKATGLPGQLVEFIEDMPAAFASADLVVCRSGAGAVSELAAAGKPSILVPFPFASDQHQLRNAEAMRNSGAALLLTDAEMSGERLLAEILAVTKNNETLRSMGAAARAHARPDAARRAADLLVTLAARRRGRAA